MISLDEIKSILETESVTVNDQKFDCIKDADKLVKVLNDLRVKEIDPDNKKETANFLLIAINALFYKHAMFNEPVNTHGIISSLAQLLEKHEDLFKTNKHYQAALTGALACMEKDPESFNITINKLLPEKITNSSLAFNLACMSNVHGVKDKALRYADLALKLNYRKNEFLTDP
jgi:hypothetical protein